MNSLNSGRLQFFFSKGFILDVQLRSEYASGTVNYFHQKLHLKSLIGLWICLCLCWVRQLLVNEISKVGYEETQKNGNKHVPFVPGNNCSKVFIKNFWFFEGKLPVGEPVAWIQPLWTLISSYFFFCYCNLWLHTKISQLIESNLHKLMSDWEGHSSLLTCSLAKFFLQ